MPLNINTNIAAIGVQGNLNRAQIDLDKSFQRLSSGLRINTAADDPAGLAVARKLEATVRSLGQASHNAQDGILMIQTAEGAYSEITDILIRMRELAIQSSSGTLSNSDRTQLNLEFLQIRSEIDRLTLVTKFNGITLVSANRTFDLQVGDGNVAAADRITVSLRGSDVTDLTLTTVSVGTAPAAQSALARIDSAITSVNSNRSIVGASVSRLNSTVAALATTIENLAAARSRIEDVDVAAEAASLARSQILVQAGVGVLAQALAQQQLALRLLT